MRISKELFQELSKLERSRLNERGWEVPNPKPMELIAGMRKPETLTEQVRRIMRTELSRQASAQGMETFEEADDFDVDDGFDVDEPTTQYQQMQEEFIFEQADSSQPTENTIETQDSPDPQGVSGESS